jgi:glycine cleavage system H protein
MGGGDVTDPTLPEELRYTKTHEWVRKDGDDVVVGITDHAQSELTDIVFVDLPKVGALAMAGKSVLVLESVKTVSDVYAPVDGTISAVNGDLTAHPELINHEPYGRGWLLRIRPERPWDPSGFLDAAGYRATLG